MRPIYNDRTEPEVKGPMLPNEVAVEQTIGFVSPSNISRPLSHPPMTALS